MKVFAVVLLCVVGCISATEFKYTAEGLADYSVKIAKVGNKELFAIPDPSGKDETWATALTNCQKLNMTIATIDNEEENKAVADYLLKRAQTNSDAVYRGYLAGTDYFTEGSWYWLTTRKPLTYTNWDEHQPTKSSYYNCMTISPDGKWRSIYCDINQGMAICQA